MNFKKNELNLTNSLDSILLNEIDNQITGESPKNDY